MLDLWRLDELRGIAIDGDALVIGALTTYTDIRRSALVPRAPARAGRGGRDDRRGPDPEPRRRSAATSSTPRRPATRSRCCWRRTRPSRRLGARRARRPRRGLLAGVPADGPRSGRAAPADPDPARRRARGPLPEGRHAASTGDQQGRDGARLARRRRRPRSGATCGWPRVGGRDADPGDRDGGCC